MSRHGRSWRRARAGIALALLAAAPLACARSTRPAAGPATKHRERGEASWYGPTFHGRLTASGERYNMLGLTAAHRTLPFGAFVRVTNLANGRRLVVRINDRGPFVRGRIIDLSYTAAKILALPGPGTARVDLVVLDPEQGARIHQSQCELVSRHGVRTWSDDDFDAIRRAESAPRRRPRL